ncbi:MAG: hypothetical protein IRY98_13250, partial [Alicyclobacillaceae bacterium]|nr:hypothetical protein [Alicyclobacillaceae bacterium]
PGQEKENAEYLTQKGAALTFYDVDHLQEQLIPLLHDDDRLFEMRRANVSLQREKAAETIVGDILETAKRSGSQAKVAKW